MRETVCICTLYACVYTQEKPFLKMHTSPTATDEVVPFFKMCQPMQKYVFMKYTMTMIMMIKTIRF